MKIHYFQHVPFEGLASIEQWVRLQGHSLSSTKFFVNEPLPKVEDIDWLIVMGGPMNIYEIDRHPWLTQEKRFIEQAIKSSKTVLGICLGSQLIADVLGARVFKNQFKEIGWFPIKLTEESERSPLFGFLPKQFTVLHWHGDTFDLPQGAIHIAKSEGCQNQAFVYGEKVIGLQFHLESTQESVQQMIQNCMDELTEGKYIQKSSEILAKDEYFKQTNQTMQQILEHLSQTKGNRRLPRSG